MRQLREVTVPIHSNEAFWLPKVSSPKRGAPPRHDSEVANWHHWVWVSFCFNFTGFHQLL